MTEIDVLDAKRGAAGAYKVDVTRGERVGWVSSEWFSCPADERFLSLSELFEPVNGRSAAGPAQSRSPRCECRPAGTMPSD